MMILIQRNGQTLGPYSPIEIQTYLESDQLSHEDMAIPQGGSQWVPLGQLIGAPIKPKTNGLAIAGFSVGLFSLIFVGLPMFAAFVLEWLTGMQFLFSIPLLVFPAASYLLSRSGYHKATLPNHNMSGKHLAITGIILSALVFALLAFLIVRTAII